MASVTNPPPWSSRGFGIRLSRDGVDTTAAEQLGITKLTGYSTKPEAQAVATQITNKANELRRGPRS